MSQLVGQSLIVGVAGHHLTEDEKKFIVQNNIGGVILFARNLDTPAQIRELCLEIQSLSSQQADKAPLFISVDSEGGRVNRFKKPFTQWPPAARLGEIDNPTVSFHFALRMGQELRAVGINLNYAPCVDVFTNPKNTVIGDRAISSDVSKVERHASGLVRGFVKSGIISCAKHFPGHGNTLLDSHFDLPVESADRNRLESLELQPFKKAFRARVDMVMTSHILYENIDPDWPCSLSEIMVTQWLRNELRFRNVIITDDLGMHALTKRYSTEQIAVRSIQAGNDILLYCNEPDAPAVAVDALNKALKDGHLNQAQLQTSRDRVLNLKKERLVDVNPLPLEELADVIGSHDNLRIAEAIANRETPTGLLAESTT